MGEPSQDPRPRRLRAVFLPGDATDEQIDAAYEALMGDEPSPLVVEFAEGTKPPALSPPGTVYDLEAGVAIEPADDEPPSD